MDDFLTLAELERVHVARAIELAAGNQMVMARLLGISRWSVRRRLVRYRLEGAVLARRERPTETSEAP